MHAVVNVPPLIVPFRNLTGWEQLDPCFRHVPLHERMFEYTPSRKITLISAAVVASRHRVQLRPRRTFTGTRGRSLATTPAWEDWVDAEDCWTPPEDDDEISVRLQAYCDRQFPDDPDREFKGNFWRHNKHGRHVLHQLAEDFRDPTFLYDSELFLQAMWATLRFMYSGLNVVTIGKKPERATVISMVCKQAWKARGCQPCD